MGHQTIRHTGWLCYSTDCSHVAHLDMTQSSATIHVTKLAAAQRQMREAIRMFFSGADQLAVHTVAYAAYGILKDLNEARGREEARDHFLMVFLQLVREYRDGSLPGEIVENASQLAQIREASERLPAGELRIEDFQARIHRDDQNAFWQSRTQIGNFLKHANRDSASHIALDKVDNFQLIAQILRLYITLVPNDLGGPEGFVFSLYVSVETGRTKGWDDPRMQAILAQFVKLPPAARLRFCATLIEQYQRDGLFASPMPL